MGGLPMAGPLLPAPGRYTMPLRSSHRESPTTMTFVFSSEGTNFRYLSNQAVRLALPEVEDPWGPVRTFSLSSSPTEPGRLAVTCRISDTAFKQALARLQPGETAQVFGPIGHFLLEERRPCVFVAGGIGVTPFRGMLRCSSDRRDPAPRRLVYSARVPEELIFRDELDAIASTAVDTKIEYTITRPTTSQSDWKGRIGRIDEDLLRTASADLDRPRYYVAGLPEMVSDVVGTLLGRLSVPESDIEYEVFRGF